MNWTAPDPNFVARIQDSFNRQKFMAHVGARLERVGPGSCVISVSADPKLEQQHGYFHGGIVGTLADNAGAYAAFTLIEAHESMLTVEYKVNLLVPAAGDRLEAIGEVIRSGRTLTVCQSRVFGCSGTSRVLCATAIVTMMALRSRGDGKPGQ